jgi:hypothetical protein
VFLLQFLTRFCQHGVGASSDPVRRREADRERQGAHTDPSTHRSLAVAAPPEEARTSQDGSAYPRQAEPRTQRQRSKRFIEPYGFPITGYAPESGIRNA